MKWRYYVVGTCHGMSPEALLTGGIASADMPWHVPAATGAFLKLVTLCHGMSPEALPTWSIASADMPWHVPAATGASLSQWHCLTARRSGSCGWRGQAAAAGSRADSGTKKGVPGEPWGSPGTLGGGGDLLSRFRSIIGAPGFNFSVRNGKRWSPRAVAALVSLFCSAGALRRGVVRSPAALRRGGGRGGCMTEACPLRGGGESVAWERTVSS